MKKKTERRLKLLLCTLLLFLLPYLAEILYIQGEPLLMDLYARVYNAITPALPVFIVNHSQQTMLFMTGVCLALPALLMFVLFRLNGWACSKYRFGWTAAILAFALNHILFLFWPAGGAEEPAAGFASLVRQLFLDSKIYAIYSSAILFVIASDILRFISRKSGNR
mgnify:CR=1 FL=1